jgi:hypothetical protein
MISAQKPFVVLQLLVSEGFPQHPSSRTMKQIRTIRTYTCSNQNFWKGLLAIAHVIFQHYCCVKQGEGIPKETPVVKHCGNRKG